MATASFVVDHISCSVCCDVFRDPHALPCLHTFCKPCIDGLVKNKCVDCPQCGELSRVKKIRKDFKTQALKDDHIANTNTVVQIQGNIKCGLCDGENVAFDCEECSLYLCPLCKKQHNKLKSCNKHTVLLIEDVLDAMDIQLNSASQTWQDEANKITEKITSIDEYMRKQDINRKNQITEVKSHINKLIKYLQKQEKTYIQQINEASSQGQHDLLKERQVAIELKAEVAQKAQYLSSVSRENDFQTMKAVSRNLKGNLKRDIKSLSTKINLIQTDNLVQPYAIMGDACAVDTGIEITFKQLGDSMEEANSTTNLDFSALKKSGYKVYKNLSIKQRFSDMRMIRNEIWCVTIEGEVQVYSEDFNLLRTVVSLGTASAVTQAHNGQIIVACECGGGLNVIAQSGTYIKHISDGSFGDVKPYKTNIFALSVESDNFQNIQIFQSEGDKWVNSRNIEPLSASGVKLALYSDTAYLFNWSDNCIQAVNMDGSIGTSYRDVVSIHLEEMYRLQVYDIDQHGNVLVIDWKNERLKVLDLKSGKWTVVRLTEECFELDSVAVVNDGNAILISTSDKKLFKYVKET